MKILTSHKVIYFFRSLVYLIVFLACIFTAFLFAEKVGSKQFEDKSSYRIMTYNIHHGEGMDGIVNLERITTLINSENPDILLLQEVDVNLDRSENVNIPEYLSQKTGLEQIVFGKNLEIENGAYGNATLSRFPIKTSRNFHFEKLAPEQRGVLATEISIKGQNVLVLNTHLDHTEGDSERLLYVEKTLTEILPVYNADTVLFGGDFNDIPSSRMYQKLITVFEDVWAVVNKGKGYTLPADTPSKRIDYIFFKGDIKPDSSWVPDTDASDHLPVVADFILVDEE